MSKNDKQGIKVKIQLDLGELSAEPPETAPTKEKGDEELKNLAARIPKLQQRLNAAGKDAMLIVLQGMDGSGKDGTIRHVLGAVNPSGCDVHNFKQPTEDEQARDFLWRAHVVIPARGHIGVFNRSYYEDVVVVRVHEDKLLPYHLKGVKDPWKNRFEQIENFERLLTQSGTHILKFFLHLSKDAQKDRFLKRQKNPEKQYKLSRSDIEERRHWDKYMEVYSETLRKTSFPFAPWTIVPSNQKWYRNLVVARAVEGALRGINPQFPEQEDKDLIKMKIR